MKKKLFFLVVSLCFSVLYSQTYEQYLAKAKNYESKKQWCYALDAYYDALGTDIPTESKDEAYDGYVALRDAILAGNPGLGKYNDFTLHDAWKKLLIEAEQYGSTFCKYKVTVGELKQKSLNYENRTATYSATVKYETGSRYKNTINVIAKGYYKAKKSDWTDLPNEWPLYSVSSKKDNVYNVNGALIWNFAEKVYSPHNISFYYELRYENAFAIDDFSVIFSDMFHDSFYDTYYDSTLFDCKFNIVDKNGKELVKGKRCLLQTCQDKYPIIEIDGITPEIMDLLDNGKAFINAQACYLEYGQFNNTDEKSIVIENVIGEYKTYNGRGFIKNLPEVQLSMEKSVFICGNNKSDTKGDNFLKVFKEKKEKLEQEKLALKQKQEEEERAKLEAERAKQEAERIANEEAKKATMKKLLDNKTDIKVIHIPNTNFAMGKTEISQETYMFVMGQNPGAFYAPDNPIVDVTPFKAMEFCNKLSELYELEPVYEIAKGNVKIDYKKNGFRLPTIEEWNKAAGIKNINTYFYSHKTDELAETSWFNQETAHPIAQKKPNVYGLYDMFGNVSEICFVDYNHNGMLRYGGNFSDSNSVQCFSIQLQDSYYNTGFRVCRNENNQTEDIKISETKNIGNPENLDYLYVKGSFNKWNDNSAYQLNSHLTDNDGNFVYKINFKATASAEEFKIANSDWTIEYSGVTVRVGNDFATFMEKRKSINEKSTENSTISGLTKGKKYTLYIKSTSAGDVLCKVEKL